MSKYSFSVTINVNADSTPTDASIGLINGVFQWFYGGDYPNTEPFISGRNILARDGISPITKSVKIERFGDIANSSGLNIKIRNTDIFWKKFLLAFGDNASLHGSTCFVDEYSIGQYQKTIYSGVCDLPNFDKSTYYIPVRSQIDTRDSMLSGNITDDFKKVDDPNIDPQGYTDSEAIGQVLPVTLGESEKTFFLQTGDLEREIFVSDIDGLNRTFPWVSGEYGGVGDAITIQLTLSNSFTDNLEAVFNNGFLYLKCIAGTAQGEIAKVTSLIINQNEAILNLIHPYSVVSTADCIFTLMDIRKEYNSDFWKCEGFINENGEAITANADLFNYNEGYQELPRFSLDINSADIQDNELIQQDLEFGDSDDVVGFEVVQGVNLSNVTSDQYFDTPASWTYDANIEAFYNNSNYIYTSSTDTQGDVSLEDESSPFQWRVTGLNLSLFTSYGFAKVFEVPIPDNIPNDFDSVYLTIHSQMAYTSQVGINSLESNVNIKSDKWYGDILNVYDNDRTAVSNQIRNFPDNYSTSGLNQEYFWEPNLATNSSSGYREIDLGISSRDQFIALKKYIFTFEFLFSRNSGGTFDVGLFLDFFSLGFTFKKKQSISKGVYTPFKGRLYDYDFYSVQGVIDWQTNDLIQDPIGALAHVKYLQNYSSIPNAPAPPSSGWGKQYPNIAANDIINLDFGTEGAYVTQDLIDFDFYDVKIATQRTDNKSVSSKAMAKDICNRFFLMSWIGDDLKERVEQVVQKTGSQSLTTITQANMISWGKRIEQDTRNIFCEPFVNYDYDVGSQKFNKSIGITNVSSDLQTDAEKAAACKGMDFISEANRVILWERARALYLYYGVVNEPPKVLSDHTWIDTNAGAYWFIRKWLRFQGSEYTGEARVIPKNKFSFETTYAFGQSWDLGTRLNVQLPNITDDLPYEFLITSITKSVSKDMPTISVSGILFDLDVRNSIQDSVDNTLDNWQDTEDPNNENIQDEV
jgi:hypothetical protein